ncbi:MAG TPA: response regulator [Verrucomicrobiae bacterium]|nr:response regulator [Verrucomicrobiae bacterium]
MHSILIVDDDDAFRETLAQALVRAGYLVLQCADGSQVMSVLEKHSADLLITDLFMPEIDGIVTIGNVRRQFPNIKIIAVSGGGNLTDHNFLPVAGKLGADAVFKKPVSLDLLKTVASLLAQQPSPQ